MNDVVDSDSLDLIAHTGFKFIAPTRKKTQPVVGKRNK